MAENQNLVGGFELRNCVASGNATQIWEVCEPGATVPFAMKLLLPDSLKDPEAKATLKHEFKVGSAMEHPAFVRFHRIEINRDHGFFIMDYFRAPSLKAQISGNLPETQSRFKKIVEALCQAFIHMNEKGWIHRDIKPDNILVNKTGEVRLIDFSLAMRISGGLMKLVAGRQRQIKGTRTYIAPETILRRTPTVQSDIYSLGITLYEVLTGAPPFAGLDPSDLLKKHISEAPVAPSIVNSNLAPDIDAVMLRMLAKKPKDRPADMREVMSMFRNVKVFLEDPLERHERKIREAKANESMSLDKRLDSRADADRVSRGLAAPAKPVKGKRLTAPIGEITPVKKPGAAAKPATGGVVPDMMPQVPYAMPQMGVPPMAMPGMMYPGMVMPPGAAPMMMPAMPAPMMPQPGMMPQPVPQVPVPQSTMPPSPGPAPMPAPVPPVMPSAPQAAQLPQPAAARAVQPPATRAEDQKPAAASRAAESILLPLERRLPTSAELSEEEAAALEFMTELPEID